LLNKLSADDAKLSTGHHRQPKAALICTAATLAKRRLKGGVGGLGRGSNPLDSFFPFDPYLLRQSFRFIEPVYKNWEGSVEEDDLMSDSEDQGSTGDEDASQSGDEDDEADDTDSKAKHMPESVDSHAFIQGTSYASNTTAASHSTKSSHPYGSPDGVAHKQAPREAWGDTLKRSRAPSIENGSW
jgi:RNA polymerase I-specific transcription initiation factor RRN3